LYEWATVLANKRLAKEPDTFNNKCRIVDARSIMKRTAQYSSSREEVHQ